MRQSRHLGMMPPDKQWWYNLGWNSYNEGINNSNISAFEWTSNKNAALCPIENRDPTWHTIVIGFSGGAAVKIDLNKIKQETGKTVKKGNGIKFTIDNMWAGTNSGERTFDDSFRWMLTDTQPDENGVFKNVNSLIEGTFSVKLIVYVGEGIKEQVDSWFFDENDINHNTPKHGITCNAIHLGYSGIKNANMILDKHKYFKGTQPLYLLVWCHTLVDRENFHVKPIEYGGEGIKVQIGYLAPSEYKKRN